MRPAARVLLLLLTAALAACSASETTMMTDRSSSSEAEAGAAASATRYRQNLNPVQGYVVTMTLSDAPGPFESIEGFAQYDISNRTCLPPRDTFSGAQTEAATAMPGVVFTKMSEDTYRGTIYLDQMLEEDIYGNGVCRWQIVQVSVRLKATGAREETRFVSSMSRDALLAGASEKTYFRKVSYPRDADMEDYSSYGQKDRSKMSASLSDSDLFSVALESEAVTP